MGPPKDSSEQPPFHYVLQPLPVGGTHSKPGRTLFINAQQSLAYFFLPIIFYAFPYRPVSEEIWRRHARGVRDDLSPILQCVISGIVVILNVKRLGREIGRGKSWPATVTIERTRLRPRGGGAAETGVTGGNTARGIRPIRGGIVSVRGSATGAGDQGQGLQKWTS